MDAATTNLAHQEVLLWCIVGAACIKLRERKILVNELHSDRCVHSMFPDKKRSGAGEIQPPFAGLHSPSSASQLRNHPSVLARQIWSSGEVRLAA
ncbi:hypothetical protein E2C01_035105 [Portunus trituberculatus]|uniref:Uncharacterized protein n=1 Tax=Portunus trituberculatus TaxID=210409 RepID=A0A5B7F2A9_PORTR|nr:hypothetical protein [Portunus trituberculatus]